MQRTDHSNQVLVKPIPHFPARGKVEDLDPQTGQLLSSEEERNFAATKPFFDASNPFFANNKYPKGSFKSRRSVYKSVEQFNEAQLYTSYITLQPGNIAKARILRNHGKDKNWAVLKTFPIAPGGKLTPEQAKEAQDRMNDVTTEHETLTKLGLAVGEIGKRSSTPKSGKTPETRWNFIMHYSQGEELGEVLKHNLPDILLIHIALQSARALHAIHTHPTHPLFHCDPKLENILCDLSTRDKKVSFVDYGDAMPFKAKGYTLPNKKGSYIYSTSQFRVQFHKEVLSPSFIGTYHYSLLSEIHALGVALAYIFDLLHLSHLPEEHTLYDIIPDLNPQTNFIADETSSNFINNQCLHDPSIRQQALALVKRMTCEKADLLPSIPEICDFLSKLKQECLKSTFAKKYRVATLNVDELLQTNKVKQHHLKAALKNCTEVWLIDTEDRGDYVYMKLRQELLCLGIPCVGNQTYIASDINLAREKLMADLNAGELQGAYQFPTLEQLRKESKPQPSVSQSTVRLFHVAPAAHLPDTLVARGILTDTPTPRSPKIDRPGTP